jgi:phosphohistidine phosphatase
MIVYLVRHGLAVNREDPDCPPDPQRPLTPKGADKTRMAMAGLREIGAKPGLILSSPLLRAWQTAEIAAQALHSPKGKIRRTEALLPDADPALLLQELARLKEEEVLCAGHAMHLDEFIAHATGNGKVSTSLKKSGAACLEIEGAGGRGVLVALYPPRTLRLLGE